MADSKKDYRKDATPPPLLLMPAGGGLTLTPPDQPNLLMPVMQSEPSIIDEDAEADSFVGQSPSVGSSGSQLAPAPSQITYFQQHQGTSLNFSDPFAHVQPGGLPPASSLQSPYIPLSASQVSASELSGPFKASSTSSIYTDTSVTPGKDSALPPPWTPVSNNEKGSTNMYRQKGPLRYAQPPSGTYASGSTQERSLPQSFGITPPVSCSSASFPSAPSSSSGSPFSFAPSVPSNLGTQSQDVHSDVLSASSFIQQESPTPSFPQQNLPLYQAVRHHWCYMKLVEGRKIWYTFSKLDSYKLEQQYVKEQQGMASQVISTDGGRYDVDVKLRIRTAVYWEEDPCEIRRCSWFFKREGDNRYVPYEEYQAVRLENEYRNAVERNDWHRRLELPEKETIVMHNPNVIVHFQASAQPDEWGNVQSMYSPLGGDQMRPRVVKRGVDDFENIEDGEHEEVDHLVFLVHGIGNTCDARFRNIVECVDDTRNIANQLIRSHFGPYANNGLVHRVEFLPVHWHGAVHSETTGVDSRLTAITLPSTRKLRNFINDTLMDILFYTSPAYCQIICDTVGQEMNRLFKVFLARNPTFSGEVSLSGHSLGASILFDILMHQHGPGDLLDLSGYTKDGLQNDSQSSITSFESEQVWEEEEEEEETVEHELTLESLLERVGLADKIEIFHKEQIDLESLYMCSEQDLKDLGLPMGPRKKLQLTLKEEKGKKDEKTLKDLEKKIRQEFKQKLHSETKQKNIEKKASEKNQGVGPNISIDYICGTAGTGQPYVKYPLLEFSPTCLFALGSPLGIFLSIRGVQQIGENFKLPTCPHVYNIFHPFDPVAYRLEPLIHPSAAAIKPVMVPHYKGRKRLHLELKESISRMGTDLKQKIIDSLKSTWNSLNEFARAHRSDVSALADQNDSNQGLEQEVDNQVDSVMAQIVQQDVDRSDTASVCSSHDDEISMGQLNEGRRVDYVLQEKPIESFNDYLFALASHGCYWTSEDTALLMLKEIYSPLGIVPIMPGPEGIMQKPVIPAHMAPPPHASSCSHSTHPQGLLSSQARSQAGSAHLSLTNTPPFYVAPSHGTSPLVSSGIFTSSQNSSRSITPPQSIHNAEGFVRPPPIAGFVRTSPLK